MLKKIKKFILPNDRRKELTLRKAFKQLEIVSEHSTKYYLELYKSQKVVEQLYSTEKRRSRTMHGILTALEILIDKTLLIDEQMNQILKVLVKTSKSDRAFIFKKENNIINLVNDSGGIDDVFISKKRNILDYPMFKKRIESGKLVCVDIKDLSEKEKDLLPEKLVALCLLPVFKKNKLWGLLGMSIYTPNTAWDEYDRIMLNSFGNIVTGILDFQ